jgi:hypothetical protein
MKQGMREGTNSVVPWPFPISDNRADVECLFPIPIPRFSLGNDENMNSQPLPAVSSEGAIFQNERGLAFLHYMRLHLIGCRIMGRRERA